MYPHALAQSQDYKPALINSDYLTARDPLANPGNHHSERQASQFGKKILSDYMPISGLIRSSPQFHALWRFRWFRRYAYIAHRKVFEQSESESAHGRWFHVTIYKSSIATKVGKSIVHQHAMRA